MQDKLEWASIRNSLMACDARIFLGQIEDNQIDLAITSPPYHRPKTGVRKYGIDDAVWADGDVCVLGEEVTERAYVEHSMEIYREIMRVLKPTGLFCLNIGYTFKNNEQSYVPELLVLAMKKAGYPRAFTIWWHKPNPTPTQGGKRPRHDYEPIYVFAKSVADLKRYYFDKEQMRRPLAESTLKRNKYPVGTTRQLGESGLTSRHTQGEIQLVDIPEMKPLTDSVIASPMFVAGKDGNGITVTDANESREIETYVVGGRKYGGKGATYDNTKRNTMKIRDGKAVEGAVWTISNASNYRKEYCPNCDEMRERKGINYKCKVCSTEFKPQRNCPVCKTITDITVLCSECHLPTHPHHAMFPEELITKIIKAMCPVEVCSKCGEPRRPIYTAAGEYAKKVGKGFHAHFKDAEEGMMQRKQTGACNAEYKLVGYKGCECDAMPIKAIVLDPFIGYGTTAVCADRFGAFYCGSDTNELNIQASKKRVEVDRAERAKLLSS